MKAAQFALGLCCLLSSAYGQAFYQWESDQNKGDVRGLLRLLATGWNYPDDPALFPDQNGYGSGAITRLISQSEVADSFGTELNLYFTWLPDSLAGGEQTEGLAIGVERSSALEWSLSDSRYAHLAVDAANVYWGSENLYFTAGRQPINLGTTFYFSPNDFFAPFRAQDFYRLYKPGVDALRLEYRLGEVSTLTAMSVLGYRAGVDSDTTWSENASSERASHLLRISDVVKDFDFALMGGRLAQNRVAAMAAQGELFEWLGIRMEANLIIPDDKQYHSNRQISLGLEHRFENNLDVRLEYYHNSQGAKQVTDYGQTGTTHNSAYLAQRYSAWGAGYEITPLLSGQVLVLQNHVDFSRLLSCNILYSLSDEAEFSLGLSYPTGKKPDNGRIRSELGTAPRTATLEVRSYF